MKLLISALFLVLPISSFAGEQIIGVGVTLNVQPEHKVFVGKLVPGASAATEGTIREGDEIVSVKPFENDATWVNTDQVNLDELVQLIRGEKDTRVTLHLSGPSGQYRVTLAREPFEVQ